MRTVFTVAQMVYSTDVIVSSDRTEPNRLLGEIKPLSVQEVSPGVYRVDMGINYAGWFEMQLQGQPGDSIVFQFSDKRPRTPLNTSHELPNRSSS